VSLCVDRPGRIDFRVGDVVRCQWVIWNGEKACTWCGDVLRDGSCGVMLADRDRFAAWCTACTLSWAASTDPELVDEFLVFIGEALLGLVEP